MPALTPLSAESMASVVPDGLDDTANSGDTSPRRGNKKKKYGFGKRFAYQKLRGFRPILSARSAQIFFITVGTLLVALGIPILIASLRVKKYIIRYDDAGPMANLSRSQQQEAIWNATDAGIVYSMDIAIQDTMEPPIYIVYELDNYFQNYRRYVRSYDPKQLRDGTSFPGIGACNPYVYQGAENLTTPNATAILPCGQISHSNFNDSYTIAMGDTPLVINDANIAWQSDASHLYGNITSINYNNNPALRGGNTSTLPLNQNQHWMVWQRPGGFSPVQKLYGHIDAVIPAGTTLTLTVANRYNTYGFNGAKKLIITTNSWVGGKNIFLPIVYLVVAGLCYVTALAFFLGYDAGLVWKRRPGAADDFSWVRQDDDALTTTTTAGIAGEGEGEGQTEVTKERVAVRQRHNAAVLP